MCLGRSTRRLTKIAAAAAALIVAADAVQAESRSAIAGPVRAHLVRVIDGDTVEVLARIWPDHYVEARVRLAGIDAPELRGRCAQEIALAERAKARLSALLTGHRLLLADVRYGKYAGRVVARVLTEDGRDVGEILLAEKLARAYDGGRRAPWCGE
ncbi:MAG: thermonuclease family protein [Alphaproteobacteria bacterium]